VRAHSQRGIRPANRVTSGLQAGLCALVFAAALAGSSDGFAAHSKTASLYWTNYGVSGTGGTIGRASLNGSGVVQSLIKGASGPVGVVVHGGYIYWSNPGIDANSPGTTIAAPSWTGRA
jgi:hypothetical protein